jgi:hypothetical protein
MERKLELKDICGYLPYKLKVLYEHSDTATVEVINIKGGVQLCEKGDWRKYHILKEIEKCKPILRPLSDLYKTITHNGKEIVPLLELAKMAFPKFHFEMGKALCFTEDTHYGILQFYYSDGSFLANLVDRSSRYARIDNQHQLFDYLHELKIDYRGLIDSGLAIDANTLETNPYMLNRP